ncbi:MAG: DEAD/DEAH box helicase [Candidatus Nanoarchaeia archaeon]
MKKSRKIKYVNTAPKKNSSWNTTDEHEIALRVQRAINEKMKIVKLGSEHDVFTKYAVTKIGDEEGKTYNIELRSLTRKINTCNCDDYRKNFLGTCKHIEKVLMSVPKKDRINSESPFVEIFVNPEERSLIEIEIPSQIPAKVNEFLKQYLDDTNKLKKPYDDTLEVMLRDLNSASETIRNNIRISQTVFTWLENSAHRKTLLRVRKEFEQSLYASEGKIDFLKLPLYDYQIKGMLHLAFSGRAMLADEMGLGKTVQAIAAACLLKKIFGINRVLVISPVSLKTEWEEQICKFTDISYSVLYGNRPERLNFYKNCKSFFVLANYEQVIRDQKEIVADLKPDIVILDEAQRIKNWRTKTARKIKALRSRYAFILTGTPLENKIDELYSIVEFIDPELLGSLFRFNRRFYNFDSEGRVISYKNLQELHEKIAPIMLRRRKDEIEEQLPERINNNYFVKMTQEQNIRYGEHAHHVIILLEIAKKRPLTEEEMDELQRHLACMRMLCDSVYILDQKVSESPKIEELVRILDDIWEDDPTRKVVIFSEWVRMLDLVRNQLELNGVDFALHTGNVPQAKRRAEINRFKNDPNCKVFISSDSGGVGLNLQVASVVVNLDLPWNPARLEQRIARVWRKYQKNCVNVINIISEYTIEHGMLGKLAFKQGLADGVLDARGDISEFEKPDAKSSFLRRLSELMKVNYYDKEKEESIPAPLTTKVPLKERLLQDFKVKIPELKACGFVEQEGAEEKPKSIFAVAHHDIESTKEKILSAIANEEKSAIPPENIAVIDSKTFDMLRKLAELGIISFNQSLKMEIKPSEDEANKITDLDKRRKFVEPLINEALRKLKMSSVLGNAGFEKEALLPALESLNIFAIALWNLALAPYNELSNSNLNLNQISLLSEKFPEFKMDFEKISAPELCHSLQSYSDSAGRLKFEVDRILAL